MPRINLLPWRDEERKERKLKFMVWLGVAAIGAFLVTGIGYMLMDSMVSAQEARNARLNEEIAILDKQIEKINSLEAEKARFIARMDVIEILYGTAALAGMPPVKAVQAELGVPHRTASDWIKKARTAGRLEGMSYIVGRQADG